MKRTKIARGLSLAGVMAVAGLLVVPMVSTAATASVDLGAAKSFAVLAGSTVTNTGSTTIGGTAGGDVGLSPGTSITGFPPATAGTLHAADANAGLAQVALTSAYNDAASRPPTSAVLIPADIGGLTFTAGVYTYSTSLGITGVVTLDGLGDTSSVFVFAAGSTLGTASGSRVLLTNGAQACNVFWQVGTSATLGTTSRFAGHVLADASITANTGAEIDGSLLARSGAVTLDSNVITNDNCAAAGGPTPTPTYSGPVQSSVITSMSASVCSTTTPYTIILSGHFPATIANVAFNGTNLTTGSWAQTETSVVVTTPVTALTTFTLQVFNAETPLLTTQVFVCTPAAVTTPTPTATPSETATVTPTPTPSETPTVIATERPTGELPNTSEPWYNIQALAVFLMLIGAAGLIIRRRTS